ncbi:MAG: hypothetical protein MJZ41_11405 [Bacteroidaceae bacterium]|nr:hypothetical protein [Bacteroidaceae bacterium]
MKYTYLYIIATAIALSSCGGSGSNDKNTGTKFAPKERTSSLSDDEREEAIAQKHSELAQEINIDSILSNHGVAFSVLPPAVDKNIPQAASDKLGTKMIQIASQNGIGGLCKNPVLAMVSRVDCVQRELTGTAPQKAIVKYEVTMYCGNFITNDIYASSAQTITGVGSTFDDAASKAMNELKNTADMQKMLSTASERAIKWYSATANVQKLVDEEVGNRNYALAMALLSSVPEQASATYAYAEKKNKEVCDMFFEEKAAELLGELEGAIAAAGEDYNPGLGAYLKVIPVRSSSYARAKQIYDNYLSHVADVKKDEREKAHLLAMEELQVEKIKAPYEAEATIAKINADARVGVAQAKAQEAKNANTGGFLGMGKLWDGTFGLANRLFDNLEGKKK